MMCHDSRGLQLPAAVLMLQQGRFALPCCSGTRAYRATNLASHGNGSLLVQARATLVEMHPCKLGSQGHPQCGGATFGGPCALQSSIWACAGGWILKD